MTGRIKIALALLAIVAAPLLMAPSGGYPTVAYFTKVTITRNATSSGDRALSVMAPTGDARFGAVSTATGNAFLHLDTSGSANWIVGNRRSDGHFVVSNAQDFSTPVLDIPTGGATTVPTAVDSGSVTITFTTVASNCSINGSNGTVLLHKIGKIVVGHVSATGSCTTAATTQWQSNNTPIPAAFRPATATSCGSGNLVTNEATGDGQNGQMCVTTTGNLLLASFASATSFALGSGSNWTYSLD